MEILKGLNFVLLPKSITGNDQYMVGHAIGELELLLLTTKKFKFFVGPKHQANRECCETDNFRLLHIKGKR